MDQQKFPQGLIFAFLIAILFLVAGLYYVVRLSASPAPQPSISALVTPQPSPQNNYQTYTDPQNHFSFQYPAKFTVSCGVSGLCTLSYCSTNPSCDLNTIDGSDDSYVIRVTPVSSIDSHFESYKSVNPDMADRWVEDTPRTLHGLTVASRTTRLHRNVFIYTDKSGVLLSGIGLDGSNLDNLIDTFKFTNQ